jgi:8-oxo-dGTP pyrophosphatase MutT (NUDIX family)
MLPPEQIDKLAWIRIEQGRLLCARSRGRDAFFLPGGKREAGESDQEALAREVREELTVSLKMDTVRFLRTFEAQAHGQPEGVVVRMTCYEADYEGSLEPSAEIDEIAWLDWSDRPRLSLVAQLIVDWLREERRIIGAQEAP